MVTNGLHRSKSSLNTGLQITVGHRTLDDQNLLMSDQSLTVVGHDAHTFFLIACYFYEKKANKSLP